MRAEVEQNQRERLFGAMIALVADKGYEATTLNDLAEVSGVSSRSIYQLYESKPAIFQETLQTVTGLDVALATQVGNDPDLGGWEERARAGSQAFTEMVVAQPAAARLVLIEGFAAGGEVTVPLEGAIAGFEALAREIAAQSPERAEMIRAHIGGMREVASTRLRQGRETELPGLLDEQWELIRSYRPPPEPLHLAGRIPSPREETLEAHDNAERVIRAFAIEVAERGYQRTTVDDVIRRGKMSATTFYDVFGGKEEALMGRSKAPGRRCTRRLRHRWNAHPTGRAACGQPTGRCSAFSPRDRRWRG